MFTEDTGIEKEIRKLAFYVCEYAVDYFKAKTHDDIKKINRGIFISKCHEGYYLAQKIIVERLLELENKIRSIRDQKAVISKGKKEKDLINDVRYRRFLDEERNLVKYMLYYRRIADTIAWTILGFNRVLIKSTMTYQEHHGYLSDKNISSSLGFVEHEKNEGRMCLINDLTNCLGAGSNDVTVVNNDLKIVFIELKEGKANSEILNFIKRFIHFSDKNNFSLNSQPLPVDSVKKLKLENFFKENEKFFSDRNIVKQIKRIFRQKLRVDAVIKYEKEGIGKDLTISDNGKPSDKQRIALILKTPDTYFFEQIEKAFIDLDKSKADYSFLHIENFIIYLITDNSKGIFYGKKGNFVRSMDAKHFIHHERRNDFDKCAYIVPEEEAKERFKKEFPIYSELIIFDWVEYIMEDESLMPPFLMNINQEILFDLLFQRKSLFTYFDKEKFVEYANKTTNLDLSMQINGKGTKELSGIEFRAFNNPKQMDALGWGPIFKMIFEFQNPESIIGQMVESYNKGIQADLFSHLGK